MLPKLRTQVTRCCTFQRSIATDHMKWRPLLYCSPSRQPRQGIAPAKYSNLKCVSRLRATLYIYTYIHIFHCFPPNFVTQWLAFLFLIGRSRVRIPIPTPVSTNRPHGRHMNLYCIHALLHCKLVLSCNLFVLCLVSCSIINCFSALNSHLTENSHTMSYKVKPDKMAAEEWLTY